MASPTRSSHEFLGEGSGNNIKRQFDLQQPILDVTPLSSVPHTVPPAPDSNYAAAPTVIDSSPLFRSLPAMVFLPPHASEKEWNDIMSIRKHGTIISESASQGSVGPTLGSIDIAESVDSYLFRVSLPGVARDEGEFKCEVDGNGKIVIQGVTTTGEKKVYKNNIVFEMKTQNLCPAGNFSITFQLPGPIDPLGLSANFGTDGIFEGIVKKRFP